MAEYVNNIIDGVTGTTTPKPWNPDSEGDNPGGGNPISWSAWHLYTESITGYDTHGLNALGKIISPN